MKKRVKRLAGMMTQPTAIAVTAPKIPARTRVTSCACRRLTDGRSGARRPWEGMMQTAAARRIALEPGGGLHDTNLRVRSQLHDVAVWGERCTNHRALGPLPARASCAVA